MLEQIIAAKKQEVAGLNLQRLKVERDPQPAAGDFYQALQQEGGRVAIIAEVKKGSPSRGRFQPDRSPGQLAQLYEQNGASAISVITDQPFFYGHKDFIRQVKQHSRLPVLRKDFIIDELQVYESLSLGADAVLLIAAVLEYPLLLKLIDLCREVGLAVLVEVHDREEVKKVLDTPAPLLGINNRNLRDFKVSLQTSLELAGLIPASCLKISESGISQPRDLVLLQEHGFHGALVGEALVTSPRPGQKLAQLALYDRAEGGDGHDQG